MRARLRVGAAVAAALRRAVAGDGHRALMVVAAAGDDLSGAAGLISRGVRAKVVLRGGRALWSPVIPPPPSRCHDDKAGRCGRRRRRTPIQTPQHGSASIEPQLIAALILLPFTAVFLYAGIHEYRRYKSEGRANYGLVYDEETGTTHVSAIAEGEDAYDPDDYDPSRYNEPDSADEEQDKRA